MAITKKEGRGVGYKDAWNGGAKLEEIWNFSFYKLKRHYSYLTNNPHYHQQKLLQNTQLDMKM